MYCIHDVKLEGDTDASNIFIFLFFFSYCCSVIVIKRDIARSGKSKLNRTWTIGKIFVYKHCFCYFNGHDVKQKNSLFHKPIVLWLAY